VTQGNSRSEEHQKMTYLKSLQVVVCGGMMLATLGWAAQNHNADPSGKDGKSGASQAVTSQNENTARPATSTTAGDYVIGAGDVLAINVWNEDKVSRVLPVRPDGKISLPLVGDVEAAGLTSNQLRDSLGEKLKAYISNPSVTVIVQEVRSRRFNVVGEVAHPSEYELNRPTTVLDAIAMAGGLQEFANPKKIYVLRKRSNGQPTKLPFNYKAVIKGENLEQNVNLEPGDTVVVP
jgi:polysaccharide export outer membrane protein